MVPTNSLSVFLRYNDSEFRQMAKYICSTLRYKEPVEDVVQDVYVKLCTHNILQNYNRHYKTNKPGSTGSMRISSLLFLVIRNHILGKMKSLDYRCNTGDTFDDTLLGPAIDNESEIDTVLRHTGIAEDYKGLMDYNAPSEDPDGLSLEFEIFKESFKKSIDNKKVFSRKRKDSPDRKSCTLLDIFIMLYKGYSNREIAQYYGVTSMSIINMRHKLAEVMVKYGLKGLME